MEITYAHKCISEEYLIENATSIDGFRIEPECSGSVICNHHVQFHVENDPPAQWVRSTNQISSSISILFFDLLDSEQRRHFDYYIDPTLRIIFQRMEAKTQKITSKVQEDIIHELSDILERSKIILQTLRHALKTPYP